MGGGRGKRFGLGNRGRKKNKKEVSRNHVEKEKKIKDQRQQLKEAHDIIQKQKQIGLEERGDSFQNTLNKLINSEKNLD